MNIAGKKVAYITLGCKLNFSETSTIRHSLEKEGTETVADKEGADIFVINTCSVTDMAEKKGRQLIRKIIHHNPGAYIVVGRMLCPAQSERNHGYRRSEPGIGGRRKIQCRPLPATPRRTGKARTSLV